MGHQYAGANSFPADFTIPDDGDAITASAFDVAYEALGDRTVYLTTRIGPYYLANIQFANGTNQGVSIGTPGGSQIVHLLSSSVNAAVNDVIEFAYSGYVEIANSAGSGASSQLQIELSQNGGAYALVPGARVYQKTLTGSGTTDDFGSPVAITGAIAVTSAGAYGLQGDWLLSTGTSLAATKDYSLVCRLWRPK